MTGLVRHLISGSQFLGYTLHKASAGTATKLMSGFDTHATVQADAARFGDLTPDAASGLLTSKDASVDIEIEAVAAHGWSVMAEAPPGRVPAHLAVNHFLLDSWVHEYDLMLPLGQRPVIDDLEAETVVGYVVALASVQTGTATPLDLRLHDPDLHVGLEIADNTAHVTVGSVPKHAPVIEGSVADVVDRATGRNGGPIHGDPLALEVLDGFAALLVR